MFHTSWNLLSSGALLTFLGFFMQESLVCAVNSPQMTFFTPPSHETMIHLESKFGYSATLKLRRPKPLAAAAVSLNSNESNNFNQNKRLAEFLVLGPDYPFHGVSAVIQEMNLRTNPEKNGCTDFIQFATNASASTRSQEICGYISREDDWSNGTTDPRRQRSFFNPDGPIYLYFYSDEMSDSKEAGDFNPENEDIGIEIVFTSFTVCPNPANSWKKLQACSRSDQMSCIYSTLFCDSKVDCGFPGEYGVDEQGCYFPYIYVTLSIIAGISLTVSLIYAFVRWVTKVPKEYR